ncbi:aromatic ring-hydroxylating oxygenase subunit alpha [Ramlibacter albus]|uniref:Rieske 2Fe-2S domain-containing protein n=1 Tax=Ramlibacter albus TaxID=2079448 RepID=A0A923M4Y3_9BURK|nr:SRPBCC family protein [Ramlibacter albus]MBC5764277.1 Rieske 2Fe-2S domain-containing protein [Ramlibacter albus]
MALPSALASQLESIRRQCADRSPCWGDEVRHIPVERYYDSGIRDAEVEQLFRKLPLIAAHSSELAPGQALAHDAYGVPMLLTRDADGRARAFLNVCRHRGMRLVQHAQAQDKPAISCPYHGWTYRLDGTLRHMLHAEAFGPCAQGERDLVALPCAERHGLVWVVPSPGAAIDLDDFLGGLNDELPFHEIESLQLFRTIDAEYAANWKLIVDAFLEPYHIRVLHRDTIAPFFTDGITAAERHGPHISSLVARRTAQERVDAKGPMPSTTDEVRRLATPSHVIFPNTITIFHPDYLSLITLYPTGPETLRWTHRMLVPKDKSTPDWTPHWEKTFSLIEQGVFQKEDIHCAVNIQKGLRTGANAHLTVGRMEQAVAWFHDAVASRL